MTKHGLNRGLHYVTGDATAPDVPGPKIIAHVCNDQGAWGAGFVLALSRRYPKAEAAYRAWAERDKEFGLGQVQLVQVEDDVHVANMVAMHGLRARQNPVPLRLQALFFCLGQVTFQARRLGASVHMPRIGTGLAGGKWGEIEPCLRAMGDELPVFIYELPKERP
jgi:O-acetyl-ADP-ribose deacetylase (regulator of RNase III)